MTLLSQQLERAQWVLQDLDTSPENLSGLLENHAEALANLAHLSFFPTMLWRQGVTAQATYALPASTVSVGHVLYNQRTLRPATEHTLDRLAAGWETGRGLDDPRYWLIDNQAPTTLRIVPAPTRTGPLTAVIPSPAFQPLTDNLLVLTFEDPSGQVTRGDQTLPTLLDYDDYLVFETARLEAIKETAVQNLPVATLCAQLSQLWLGLLMKVITHARQ